MKRNLFLPFQLILILLSTIFSTNVFSQKTTNSPYSSYGIGSTEDVDNAIFSGFGNNNISYCDSTVLNYFNY